MPLVSVLVLGNALLFYFILGSLNLRVSLIFVIRHDRNLAFCILVPKS